MLWNPEKTVQAWNFASWAHRAQMLPGADIPYLNHIGHVTMEIMTTIAMSSAPVIADPNPDLDPDLAVQCALLHDTIEDTDTEHPLLLANFGQAVADGVMALTKDKSLSTKKERMADSIHRIRRQPREVWMVKLADRITNLQQPPTYWSKTKIVAYRDEALFILENLQDASPWLAERLKQKIANYIRFF